jgi:hypothetical protein
VNVLNPECGCRFPPDLPEFNRSILSTDIVTPLKGFSTMDAPETSNLVVTVPEVIGHNVTLALEVRGWDRTRLADEGALLDMMWDEAAIRAIEAGTVDLTASDLVTLAVVLGVAPHLFLYPQTNVRVAVTSTASEEPGDSSDLEQAVFYAETHMPGNQFADWLWSPDAHDFSHAHLSEKELWNAAN